MGLSSAKSIDIMVQAEILGKTFIPHLFFMRLVEQIFFTSLSEAGSLSATSARAKSWIFTITKNNITPISDNYPTLSFVSTSDGAPLRGRKGRRGRSGSR